MPVLVVDAILFDLDGTLIDSTPGVIAAWNLFAVEYGFSAAEAIKTAHGVRLVDSLKKWCKIEEDQKIQAEVSRFEREVISGGPVALPGAKNVLEQIDSESPGVDNPGWAIVTSATASFALDAIKQAGIRMPQNIVSASDVAKGKPYPDPYLAGAKKCQVMPENCLVIEDAPSGIKSGKAAGAKTLAVCTSHGEDAMRACQPDFVVPDLTWVSARRVEKGIEITVREAA